MTRKWVIIIPVLAGIAAIAFLKQNKMKPVQEPIKEQAKLVRVIEAPSITITPRAIGHGTAKPARSWEAVSQVKGKILEKHPKLLKGGFLQADTVILRIDPTDYELAVARTEADIQATRAQQQELNAKAANTRASLKIEQAALVLNEKELARKRKLIGKGSVSRSDLENQERSLLGQQQSVQSQNNTLNLIPSQKALLEAQLARHQATLATARRDLANTEIRIPFTGRIADVKAEQDQYIREGEILATADDLQLAEVEIQIPMNQMSNLIHSTQSGNPLNAASGSALNSLGLSATVKLEEGELSATWQARVARFSDTLDPKTRTIGVIVEVEKPYAEVTPGIRPPLFKGLFVTVELAGKPRPDSLVIPRSALHGGKIHIVNKENRLEIRDITVELTQPEFVVIDSGLNPGEHVVVSDLVPAIEGMLLKPSNDDRVLQRLIQITQEGSR